MTGRETLGALAIGTATLAALLIISLWMLDSAGARDTTGLSDTLSQEQRDWVRSLRGKNSVSCCDDADGVDPIWEIHGRSYRVRYKSEWLDVDDEALLTMPNRLGVARAWIGTKPDGGPFVRCFLPGPTI